MKKSDFFPCSYKFTEIKSLIEKCWGDHSHK